MRTQKENVEIYLEALRELPFVQKARVLALEQRVGNVQTDATIELRTRTTSVRMQVELNSSHLTYGIVDRVIAQFDALEGPWILAAPYIGAPMAGYLRERDVCYIDLLGNCHLKLGDEYLALIEGRTRPPRQAAFKGVRAAGYQVLFAFVAKPELVAAPIREVAHVAGVSRQAVLDMRNRLAHEGVLVKAGKEHRWVGPRRKDAVDRWLVGYTDVVRPSLLIGRYSTPDSDPAAQEKRVRDVLGKRREWRYGGCAAGYRLTGHYRGRDTVVHVDHLDRRTLKRLKALPSENGPLIVLRAPGPVAFDGATSETVHPLLVYSEMLQGGERARESALEILVQYIERS